MSQWLVNRGDSQFTVDGLSDLVALAQKGDLDAGDLIQPEGASDWVYAIEIPELKGKVKAELDEDEVEFRKGGGAAAKGVLFAVFGALFLGGVAGMGYFYTKLPTGDEQLIGEGGALKYTELLALAPTSLFAEPDANSSTLAPIPQNAKLDLLAKRGAFYKARVQSSNQEGWVRVDDTLAVYQMGDDKIKRKMDPLYNPDQYTKVSNAAWSMFDEEGNTTATFRFSLENVSDFDMTDLRLEAVIKDSKGTEVGSKEFSIEGVIPAGGDTMVGTLPPPEDVVKAAEKAGEEPPPSQLMTYWTFDQAAKDLPAGEEQDNQYLRWIDGVDIEVDDDFVEATVRIVELRAVPK